MEASNLSWSVHSSCTMFYIYKCTLTTLDWNFLEMLLLWFCISQNLLLFIDLWTVALNYNYLMFWLWWLSKLSFNHESDLQVWSIFHINEILKFMILCFFYSFALLSVIYSWNPKKLHIKLSICQGKSFENWPCFSCICLF